MVEEAVPPHEVVLTTLRNAPLKSIFLVHFILTTWGIQGYWSPDSYLFYNLLFFITLFWSIHEKESAEPVVLCFVINVLAILFDVIVLAAYYPVNGGSSNRFSVAMAILNLVLRPISSYALYQQHNNRSLNGGAGATIFPSNSARPQRNYQDIETSGHQSVPKMNPAVPPPYQ